MALFGGRKLETPSGSQCQPQLRSEGHPPSVTTARREVTQYKYPVKDQNVTVLEKGVDCESARTPSADSNEQGNVLAQEQAETGPSNPFSGGVDGGVTYMSLSWW